MRRLAAAVTLAGAALLSSTAPAHARVMTPPLQAPSFDCASTRTGAEWMVCNDPSLAAADRLQQRLYHLVMNADRPSRLATRALQRQWLKQRDGCRSAACVGDLYAGNLATLAEASGFAGWTQLKRTDAPGELQIFTGDDGWSAAYLHAWRRSGSEGPADVQFALMFPTRAQPATMAWQGCRIVVSPMNTEAWSVNTREPCAVTAGLFMDGIYRRGDTLEKARERGVL